MFQILSNNLKNLKLISLVQPESLKGKRVLVRCDFNVPINSKKEIDDFSKIDRSLKTINYLKNSGAKVVLVSHIGREESDSLVPVFEYLKTKYDVSFIDDIYSEEGKEKIESLYEGGIILIENLRKWKGEKENDVDFVKLLASFGDIFVNEAFSASHRDHASITGVPLYLRSYVGFQFADEVENISKVFEPEHPFLVLMGGAKFETKIPVIEALLDKADFIFVGGALSNDILKANNYEVGQSKVNDMDKKYAKSIFDNKKVSIVEDVKVKSFLFAKNKSLQNVTQEDKIIDGGTETANILSKKIKEAKFIVWNGPFGTFEQGNSFLSKKVVEAIIESDAYSIVGGGDTVSEIKKLNKENSFSFLSLAGGAMLEFIAKGTLVGIEAINK